MVAENEVQDTTLVRADGYALDGLWNDDFHHSAVVAATGRNEAYYSEYLGSAQELLSAAKHGYLYQEAALFLAEGAARNVSAWRAALGVRVLFGESRSGRQLRARSAFASADEPSPAARVEDAAASRSVDPDALPRRRVECSRAVSLFRAPPFRALCAGEKEGATISSSSSPVSMTRAFKRSSMTRAMRARLRAASSIGRSAMRACGDCIVMRSRYERVIRHFARRGRARWRGARARRFHSSLYRRSTATSLLMINLGRTLALRPAPDAVTWRRQPDKELARDSSPAKIRTTWRRYGAPPAEVEGAFTFFGHSCVALTSEDNITEHHSPHSDHQGEQATGNGFGLWNGLGGLCLGNDPAAWRRAAIHGLLVVAMPAPLGRMMTVSDLSERLRSRDGEVTALQEALVDFRLEMGLPVWTYRSGDALIEKRLRLIHRQNTVHVSYRLLDGAPLRLKLRPAVHFRPHEDAVSATLGGPYQLISVDDRFEISSALLPLRLRMHVVGDNTSFTMQAKTLETPVLALEVERGYDSQGQIYSPGYFAVDLGRTVTLILSTEEWETIAALSPDSAAMAEQERRQALLALADRKGARTPIAHELVLAAGQFVIAPARAGAKRRRGRMLKVTKCARVIAGYHWFTD